MDFSAKSVWIYENNVPDVAKLHKYGIKVVYIDPRSTNHASVISQLHSAGITVGAYFADSWNAQMTPLEWSTWASHLLNDVLPRTGTEAPPCMLDLETHDTARQSAIITSYRAHQPARPTSYTNAPMQAPICPWAEIKKGNMPYYVQLYGGNMSPVDVARAILEVCRYYGDASKVFPFYDGARWGTDQVEGCYFTLERMP